MSRVYLLHKYHYCCGKNNQKSKIEGREESEVLQGFAFDVGCIFTEGYKACKGRNECADATDIYTEKQFAVVFSKLGEQNCRWDITYHLAREDTCQKCVFFKQG